MKYLLIENGQAYYVLSPEAQKIPVEKINKDDLLALLDLCIAHEDFEMDPYDEALLQNKAHQIIYKNICQKFTELRTQRTRFSDEKTVLYRAAITKYSAEME